MTFNGKFPVNAYNFIFDGEPIETAFSYRLGTNPTMGEARDGQSKRPKQVYHQVESPVITVRCVECNQPLFATSRSGDLSFDLGDVNSPTGVVTCTIPNVVVGAQDDDFPGHGAEPVRGINFHLLEDSGDPQFEGS